MTTEVKSVAPGSLKDDVDALREDLRRLRVDFGDTARHAASAAKDRAGHAYDAVRERAGEAIDSAKDHAKNAKDKVGTQIEDHPFMAIGIAFGAGLLLGALLRSRH